jgi:hypothetical protein
LIDFRSQSINSLVHEPKFVALAAVPISMASLEVPHLDVEKVALELWADVENGDSGEIDLRMKVY